MKSILKLGTRKSLLAWAQSSWVAREVEKNNLEVQVELIGIETRGDRILDVPLQMVEGKEFFVAEIDAALKSGEVDFTVHSMKDLSLERPREFVCAAIPIRENPRDVILFNHHVIERIQKGIPLKIGTSSPRRVENIPTFLGRALPQIAPTETKNPPIEFVEIRGNVNTRLSRVHESVESPRYLDGVVLAFAGLIRLWADPNGQQELTRLLDGVRWMVLPLKECPSAPAQGALAVECRAGDIQMRDILNKIHHPETEKRVQKERGLLAEWGGGCHQRFGAVAVPSEEMGDLFFIRGIKPDGEFVEDLSWNAPPRDSLLQKNEAVIWDGSVWRSSPSSDRNRAADDLASDISHSMISREPVACYERAAVFVAHSRAAEPKEWMNHAAELFHSTHVWTSGTASWFKLAEQGIWVEGCAEGLGFTGLIPILQEKVLRLPKLVEWHVLTHAEAGEEWENLGMKVIPTYKINLNYGNDVKAALKKATHVFWSSGSQWDELKEEIPPHARHACGPGKTVARLRASGLNPEVFPSVQEWRKWLQEPLKK